MGESILKMEHVNKTFSGSGKVLHILSDISLDIQAKETVAIMGPSGSGKTTLLGICAGLDKPSSGKIELCGAELTLLNQDETGRLRNKKVGFVFQNFQLLPSLTALENVMVPLELLQVKDAKEQAAALLARVGLGERNHHFPVQLSGGEQQRVAIARAFANKPTILFADEPTGNLDTETGLMIEELILDLNKELGTTLVLVTHDEEFASRMERVIRIKGGKLLGTHV